LAVLTAFAAAVLTACGNGTDKAESSPASSGSPAPQLALTAEEQAYLDGKGTLQVGAFSDYPPFGFVDEAGQAIGMSVDYWNMIGDRLGVKVAYTPALFNDQLDGLKQGRFDSLAGIFPLPEREQWFAFTEPYFEIDTVIYTDAAHTSSTSLDSLKADGLTVAVVKGDSGQSIADGAGLKTKVVAGYPDAVNAVASGAAQAMILDELVAAYFIAQDDLSAKVIEVGEPVAIGQMTLPVDKDNTLLLSVLNKAIASLGDQQQTLTATWLEK
jgi:polar amino acid transport system substrate-binding protein